MCFEMGDSMSLNLLQIYEQQVTMANIQNNVEQCHVLSVLEQSWQLAIKHSWLPWHQHRFKNIHVYIYGSVGSGKTFVMDLFYQAIPHSRKGRFHFHYFMEDIAHQLKQLQGQVDPMKKIVKQLVKQYDVICMDEMMVQDVVQAMILRELLPELMANQVMLVMTSNIEPEYLYENGLQRERFMTVIEHLETYAHILSLRSSLDYRLQRLPAPKQVYWMAPDEAGMQQQWDDYVSQLNQTIQENPSILIQEREIPVKACTQDMVWFDFKDIANIPRCQRDYLELAKRFKIVFISGIPTFQDKESAALILWMYLIDVFYDAHIKLVMGASTPFDKLYPTGHQTDPFQRTLSRMQEMQSDWYWQV